MYRAADRRTINPSVALLRRSFRSTDPPPRETIPMNFRFGVLTALGCAVMGPATLRADAIDRQLAVISAVGPNAQGSQEARIARRQLAAQEPEILPRLLEAMDTDNIVAANWYRTAYEEIVNRELARESPNLPLGALREYVRNEEHRGRVRRLALDLLNRMDPDFGRELVASLLDDPEFREDAVNMALKRGDQAKNSGESDQARKEYQTAFLHARTSSQVTQAADRLKSIGAPVSIVEHMGFVTDWYVIGPFDAPGKTGFSLTFPPESGVDLNAEYAGKTGRSIAWKRIQSEDRLGLIDLNRAIAPSREAVGYAYAELISPGEQNVELRCGADDNLTVWLNGDRIFGREQWLNGIRLDRFTAPARLRAGRNRLFVKVCQGPQHSSPDVPNNWSLQLRFCNEDGKGVGLKSALPE